MKKVQISIANSFGSEWLVSAWEVAPGLAAWNDNGVALVVLPNPLPWKLVHVPSGKIVASAKKRDDLVELANRFMIDGSVDFTWPEDDLIEFRSSINNVIYSWKQEYMYPTYYEEAAQRRITLNKEK